MKKSTSIHKNKNVVTREIEDETILIPIFKTAEEMNYIYSLNKAAAWVWKMIDGRKTLGEIKSMIIGQFDATPQEVESEIRVLLGDLEKIKAIIID